MELNVVSFNIRCCDDKGGYSIAERAPRLNAVIAPYNADILALQEYRPAWEKHIAAFYDSEYDMFLKYRNQTVDIEASPILWKRDKFALVDSGYFWLSDTPLVESRGWDEVYNCFRMCAWVILEEKSSGTRFAVMNTHFGFGDRGQIKSAELIAGYSASISPYPTVILGDFNMHPDSPAYAVMTEHFCDANMPNPDLSTTYHGYSPEGKNEHIDYCFVNKGVKSAEQKIITETVDGKYPSDHFGLFIKTCI